MLAYIFWHWPRPDIPQQEYEVRLEAFHRGMAEQPPAGFRRSLAWRVEGAAWLPDRRGYEDWYLLDDSGALDSISAGALAGGNRPRHDTIASLAAGGTAGLYKPARVPDATANGETAVWFGKPAGMTYGTLYSSLDAMEGIAAEGVWLRMLVLGPTPELCLLGDAAPALPAEWGTVAVRRLPVWP